jgi:hypothetical protein
LQKILLSPETKHPLIEDLTIQFRQQHRVKLPDAIIAATATAHGIKLLKTCREDVRSGINPKARWGTRSVPYIFLKILHLAHKAAGYRYLMIIFNNSQYKPLLV